MKKFLFGTSINAPETDLGLLLSRLLFGLIMATMHGWGKMPVSDRFIKGVGGMGFPLPEFFAWAAGLSEFLGGILIAIGLATRPSAFFLLTTMLVAAFVRHGDDPFSSQEKSLLYAVAALLFLFSGAGRYSIDAYLNKKKRT